MLDADGRDDVDVLVLTGADPAFCAGARPQGARARPAATSAAAATPTADPTTAARGPFPRLAQAADRGDQRGRRHRRARAGAQLRLPGGVGAGQVRRHPRPRRCDAGLGSHRAAAPGDRRPPGAGDELHRQLPVRRARRCDFGLVNHVVAHDELLPFTRRLAADIAGNEQSAVRQLRSTYAAVAHDDDAMGDRSARRPGVAAQPVQPREGGRAARRDPGARPDAVTTAGADGRRRRDLRPVPSARVRFAAGLAIAVVVVTGAVRRRAAAPQRAHAGRRLRPLPAPGAQPVRRGRRTRSSPTTGSRCSTRASPSAPIAYPWGWPAAARAVRAPAGASTTTG